jgi:hypothetical protein
VGDAQVQLPPRRLLDDCLRVGMSRPPVHDHADRPVALAHWASADTTGPRSVESVTASVVGTDEKSYPFSAVISGMPVPLLYDRVEFVTL